MLYLVLSNLLFLNMFLFIIMYIFLFFITNFVYYWFMNITLAHKLGTGLFELLIQLFSFLYERFNHLRFIMNTFTRLWLSFFIFWFFRCGKMHFCLSLEFLNFLKLNFIFSLNFILYRFNLIFFKWSFRIFCKDARWRDFHLFCPEKF